MEVKIRGISFAGDFVGQKIPVVCPNCGIVEVSIPFDGMDHLTLANVSFRCPSCNSGIRVATAFYEFERRVIELLAEAKISRQQARRFAREADKAQSQRDLDNLEIKSGFISPGLSAATRLAKTQKDPLSAIKVVGRIALFLVSMGGGVLVADELWDKYVAGQLFEQSNTRAGQSENPDQIEGQPQDNADNEAQDGDKEPPENWKGVDL